MPDIHIQRDHHLGLPKARALAMAWAEQAETDFGMECTYAEGDTEDEVGFSRSGVSGTLMVTAEAFELQARLGFLLGAFKERIESEIVRNLDGLLADAADAKASKTKSARKPARAPARKAAPKSR
jgi:putative polyhydroxyalkanoate system protein